MRENLAGDYYLVSDITFPAPGTEGFPAEGFEPVGCDTNKTQSDFQGTPFTGKFDGNGHTIRNLFIQRPDESYVGLFGRSEDATISNVRLNNVNIQGAEYVGAIVGSSRNGSVSGAVLGNSPNNVVKSTGESTGGLVGWSSGAVTGYAKDLEVSVGKDFVGGLVGSSFGNVTGYTQNLIVSGKNFVGGLVGWTDGKIVGYSTDLRASGEVRIGGLLGGTAVFFPGFPETGNTVGKEAPEIFGYATGELTATLNRAGGLVGQLGDEGKVVGFYRGTITGNGNVGGLTGLNHTNTAFTRGYMRGTLKKNGFSDKTYGFLVAGSTCSNFTANILKRFPSVCTKTLRGDIAGYSSGKPGERELVGISGSTSGNDGTEITIGPGTTQADFSDLDFGSEPGQWAFHAGKWPSINLGPDPLFANTRQPIEP